MKRIASSFQKLLGAQRSKNWETFCPVFIGTNGDLVAYGKKPQNWRKMPSVSFLPENVLTTKSDVQIEGALLYAASHLACSEDTYVANILTRTWKRLPLPPTFGCMVYSSKLVVTDRSLETYKVIVLCQRDLYNADFLFLQIYDSKPGSWSCMRLELKSHCDAHGLEPYVEFTSAFLDGLIYITTAREDLGQVKNLFAFNLGNGCSEKLELSRVIHNPVAYWEELYQLVVCEDKLLMVVADVIPNTPPIVMTIDLDLLTLTQWSDGPSSISCRSTVFVKSPGTCW